MSAGTWMGWWPLAWGRFLVGDLVTLGPVVFAIAGIAHAVVGAGLLRVKNWARRAAVVIAAAGLYFLIAPVSSAVADLRLGAIAYNGAQIMVRVAVMWYLMQEHVTTCFSPTQESG